jgi:hypothetical protein
MVIIVFLGANPTIGDGDALPIFRFLAGAAVMKRHHKVAAGAQAVGPGPALLCTRRQLCTTTEPRLLARLVPEGGTTTPTRRLMLSSRDDSSGVPRLKAAPKKGIFGSM